MNYTIVGIDFGTSTTVVKVKKYFVGMNPRDCQTLMFGSYPYLSTLVFEDENNRLYFGSEAEAQANAGVTGTMYENFKMGLIGNSEQQAQAKRLIKEYFKYIYTEFDKQRQILNATGDIRTNVSYPVKWTPEIKSLMKQCAQEAGFSNVSGEGEPTAAIYASLASRMEDLQKEHIIIKNQAINAMMLDMGAGTSDIAIFTFKIDSDNKVIIDEQTTYPTVDNTYLCGGREIDKLLYEHLRNYVKSVNNQISEDFFKQMKTGIKSWKESILPKHLQENKAVGLPANVQVLVSMFSQNKPFENIDRHQFELITQSHWQQLRSLIADAVKEAKNILPGGAMDIDLVILTGGHSQWYGIKEFILGNDFAALEPIDFAKIKQQPQRLLQEARPQETVAHGLIFKDLPFDVKHTMGNSVWIQFEIDGQKSELFDVCSVNDVLPVTTEKNWTIIVEKSRSSIESLPVICHCYCGSEIETAKYYQGVSEIQLNDAITAAVGFIFGGFAGAQDKYEVKISATIDIEEDGTAKVTGISQSKYNKGKTFIIMI